MLRTRPVQMRYLMGRMRFPYPGYLGYRNMATGSEEKPKATQRTEDRPKEFVQPKYATTEKFWREDKPQMEYEERHRKDIPIGGTRPTSLQKLGLVIAMMYPNFKSIPEKVSALTMRRMRGRMAGFQFFLFAMFVLFIFNFQNRYPAYEARRQSALGINPHQKQEPKIEERKI